MKTMTIKNISEYANFGQAAEQSLVYALTGEIRAHRDGRFWASSDIPEFNMSVKSDHFTLAAKLQGDTMQDMVNDYFTRTESAAWAYVTREMLVYIMTALEFRAFIEAFGVVERESEKNGGGLKVRCKHESKKMLAWLANMA